MANNTAKAISIHAPARGATHNGKQTYKIFCNFNPRSREGSDKYRSLSHATDSSFQSTLPRGERQENMIMAEQVIYFNPRSREGSDRKYTQTTNIISVYFYLYYIIFVSLATNTAYITITKPSKCRCESPYTFC